MCFKTGKTLILTTVLVIMAGLSQASVTIDENVAGEDPLGAAFAAWAAALEAVSAPGSDWEYPFGAPKPSGLSRQDVEVVLGLRRLTQDQNLAELEKLADQVERRQDEIPVQMRFWLAFAQGQLRQNEACLANLLLLLAVPEGWRHLEEGQQAWVLNRTPDLQFLQGQRNTAADLYERLASSSVDQLSLWGRYQLAGLDFLARDFEEAASKYEAVCESDVPGSWREHACAMVEMADRLSRLGKEGETDDAVASINP